MLVNSYTHEGRAQLVRVNDSNLLHDLWGVTGATFADTTNRFRLWTVQALYAPVRGRKIGGIRAKLYDQKGFVAFCNQRDLEVLLDIVSPGAYCQWLDEEYVEPNSEEWLGPCTDETDLVDDLFDRECEARRSEVAEGAMLPPGMSFSRLVHGGYHDDFEETMTLLWDMCRETQLGPDTRFETVITRWSSVERTHTLRRDKLWHRL